MWMIAASAAWILLLRMADSAPPSSREHQGSSVPDMKMTGFHLVETKDGAKLWEIWGDAAEVFEKEGVAKVKKISRQVAVTLYSEQGQLTSLSDRATLNMRTKDVRLDGNVTATAEPGSSLQTDSLDWSAQERRLFTRSPITLVKGGLLSRGVGMEAETNLERARLFGRVRSQVLQHRVDELRRDLPIPRKGGS